MCSNVTERIKRVIETLESDRDDMREKARHMLSKADYADKFATLLRLELENGIHEDEHAE